MIALLTASPAFAQPVIVADSGDTGFVLASALLALATILGGTMLATGRSLAARGVMGAIALTVLLFAAIGYSLIFADGSAILGGAGAAFLGNLATVRDGLTIPESAYVLYELAAAVIAVALLAAHLAGHARIRWLVPFAGLWFLIVYVPVARWIWSGWLTDLGAIDYAGGIVIHVTAGTGALVASLLLRGSTGRDIVTDGVEPVAGRMLTAAAVLAIIGGAALGGTDDAGTAIANAMIGASAAALVAMLLPERAGASVMVAMLGGLAALSAAGPSIGVVGAMALGAIAAILGWAAQRALAKVDPAGGSTVFAAHAVGGMAGAMLFPLFVLPALGGPGFGDGLNLISQLAAQVIATVAVALWTTVATAIAALAVSMLAPMRSADPR